MALLYLFFIPEKPYLVWSFQEYSSNPNRINTNNYEDVNLLVFFSVILCSDWWFAFKNRLQCDETAGDFFRGKFQCL